MLRLAAVGFSCGTILISVTGNHTLNPLISIFRLLWKNDFLGHVQTWCLCSVLLMGTNVNVAF